MEFRKSEKWENVFNGGATTSGRMDKWRPRLDSARRICLGCMSHEVLTVVVDVSTGDEVCWGGIPNIGKVAGCFSQDCQNQRSYGQRETTAGFTASNRSRKHLS